MVEKEKKKRFKNHISFELLCLAEPASSSPNGCLYDSSKMSACKHPKIMVCLSIGKTNFVEMQSKQAKKNFKDILFTAIDKIWLLYAFQDEIKIVDCYDIGAVSLKWTATTTTRQLWFSTWCFNNDEVQFSIEIHDLNISHRF